jgi:hypothetical protein
MDVLDKALSKAEESSSAFVSSFQNLTTNDRRRLLKSDSDGDSAGDGDDDEGAMISGEFSSPPLATDGHRNAQRSLQQDEVEEIVDAADDSGERSASRPTSALAAIFSKAPLEPSSAAVQFDNFFGDCDGEEEVFPVVADGCLAMQPAEPTLGASRSEHAVAEITTPAALEHFTAARHNSEGDDDVPPLPEAGLSRPRLLTTATVSVELRQIATECEDSVTEFGLDPTFDYDAVAAGISRKFVPR